MNSHLRSLKHLFVLSLVMVVGGCGSSMVALRSAPDRKIVIVNDTDKSLELLPAKDAPGAASKTIAPDARETIDFAMYKVIHCNLLVKSEHGWYEDKGDQAHDILVADDSARYLDMDGPDAVARFRRPDGEIWQFRFELRDCLYDPPPPAGYEVHIEDAPDPVTPMRLCRTRRPE